MAQIYSTKIGNASKLKNLPSGIFIHNIEIWPGSGARYARASGVSAQLLKQYNADFAIVRFYTGEQRLLFSTCQATIGTPVQLYLNYNSKSLVN